MMVFENILGVLTVLTLGFGAYVFSRATLDIVRMFKARAPKNGNTVRNNRRAVGA